MVPNINVPQLEIKKKTKTSRQVRIAYMTLMKREWVIMKSWGKIIMISKANLSVIEKLHVCHSITFQHVMGKASKLSFSAINFSKTFFHWPLLLAYSCKRGCWGYKARQTKISATEVEPIRLQWHNLSSAYSPDKKKKTCQSHCHMYNANMLDQEASWVTKKMEWQHYMGKA